MIRTLVSQNVTHNTLALALTAIQDGNNLKALSLLTPLQNDLAELPLAESDVISQVVCNALLKRLKGKATESGSLYLQNHQQQIELFNIMAKHFPLVTIPTHIANTLIYNAVSGYDKFALLDIGIGTGRQTIALLKLLAEGMVLPSEVTILGIEPSAVSLLQAETALLRVQADLGCRINFVPFCSAIEKFRQKDWLQLKSIDLPLVINAAFSLHHIVPPKHSYLLDPRDRVLKELKMLNPELFVVTEPHANHNVIDLKQRYESCKAHYGLVFSVLDTLYLSQEVRFAIKQCFFAKEINNIIGFDGFAHTERHELGETWQQRFVTAGFENQICLQQPELEAFEETPITIVNNKSYLKLCYNHNPIVNIFAIK
jgi:SAM-dependent methyltransferase